MEELPDAIEDDAAWETPHTHLARSVPAKLSSVSCVRQVAEVRQEVSRAITSSIALREYERVNCLSRAGQMIATMHYAAVGADSDSIGEVHPLEPDPQCPTRALVERVRACDSATRTILAGDL